MRRFWLKENCKFAFMKPKKQVKKKYRPKVTVNPELDKKYQDGPYFKEKMERAKHILSTYGMPDF